MKKIAFIMAGTLPMPPVKGGAVENLVDFILKKNEEDRFYNIDVYSCENNHDTDYSSQYKYTYFIPLMTEENNTFSNKLKMKLMNKLNLMTIPLENYIDTIVQKVSTKKYDVIIVENRPMYIPIIRKNYSGTLVLHLHNDTLNKNTPAAKKIINDVDYVFAITDYIKKRIVEIDKNKKEKVKILHNGIEVEKFHMSILEKERNRQILFSKYGINTGDKVIIYSGRLVKEKGVLELVKAFNKVENLHKNLKLLIVGSSVYGQTIPDDYLVELKNEISKNSSKVIFTGYVDYHEINKLYNIADIGVVPSLWQEPAALTALEIQASGLPIIATNTGGLSEMVGTAGIKIELTNTFVDDLANAIISLIINEDFYKESSKKSFENAQQYSTENYYLNFKKLVK